MADNIVEIPKQEVTPSYEGIADRVVATLEQRGVIEEPKVFERMGVQALGGTNETGNPHLFEKVRQQEQAPNGYLIGIGAANIFCMLEAFPQGVEPKAVLLFDIDPEVVTAGQALIEHFRQSDTYPQEMLGPSDEHGYFRGEVFPKYIASQFKVAINKYATLLHKLAREGRFVIAQVDFTNPILIEELGNLPDLKNSNNVIYLSNIADHIWRKIGYKDNRWVIPDFSFLKNLFPNSPHRNYYIDTLLRGLTYNLRIGATPPHFEITDFGNTSEDTVFQTKPTDEIDGLSENPVWEDIRGWSLEKLLQTYGELSARPQQKDRREFIQRRITENRAKMLEQYDERKRLSKEGPKELFKGKYSKMTYYQSYVVPTDPKEEKELLVELAKPYDYDKDFIPFLARNYWGNMVTPPEIGQPKMPKQSSSSRKDPETGNSYSTLDAKDVQKGKIEIDFLQKVPFEELALAKFYREVEKRLLARNPTVTTTGKDVAQLSDDLQFGRPLGK